MKDGVGPGGGSEHGHGRKDIGDVYEEGDEHADVEPEIPVHRLRLAPIRSFACIPSRAERCLRLVDSLHSHATSCIPKLPSVDKIELRVPGTPSARMHATFDLELQRMRRTLWSGTTSRFHEPPLHMLRVRRGFRGSQERDYTVGDKGVDCDVGAASMCEAAPGPAKSQGNKER